MIQARVAARKHSMKTLQYSPRMLICWKEPVADQSLTVILPLLPIEDTRHQSLTLVRCKTRSGPSCPFPMPSIPLSSGSPNPGCFGAACVFLVLLCPMHPPLVLRTLEKNILSPGCSLPSTPAALEGLVADPGVPHLCVLPARPAVVRVGLAPSRPVPLKLQGEGLWK